MQVSEILREIDQEISRLQQARALLAGEPIRKKPGRPKGSTNTVTKRKLTPDGRRRIAEAMKKRWALRRKQSSVSA
jgi:hypothetical protein